MAIQLFKYNEYKSSKIEGLNDIPVDWVESKIVFISEIQGRIGFKGYSVSDLVSKGEGAITIGAKHISKNNILDLTEPDFISWDKYFESPEIMVKQGQLLVVQRGSLGKIAIVDSEIGEATINPSMLILKNIFIDVKFFYYYLSSSLFKGFIDIVNTATAVPMITQQQLGSFKVAFPNNKKEQTQIAKFLDYKTSQIDKLIEQKEKLLKLLTEKRTAIITQAVTKGLNPTVEMKDSGIDWLGEIPKHWEVKKIKHLSPVYRGASPRPIADQKYFDVDGEYAWVRIADVTANDHYLTSTTQQLSDLGASLSVKLNEDTLFLSIAGSVGKPMINKIKCCIHDGFVYFPKIEFNKEFLYRIFETGQPYKGLGKLGTQLNLNTDTVGNIKIALPKEFNEIDSIIQYLDVKLTEFDIFIAKINKSINKLNEYREAIITSAVTGQIDVRK